MTRTRNPYQYEITGVTIQEISECVKDFCIKQNSLASVIYLNYHNVRKLIDLTSDVKFEMSSPFNPDAIQGIPGNQIHHKIVLTKKLFLHLHRGVAQMVEQKTHNL